jgi:hypothetical protein
MKRINTIVTLYTLLTEELYDSILADFAAGDYGEATLDEGDNRLIMRNRMKAAASRRGVAINFRRTQGDLLRFQVVEHSNGNSKPTAPVEPPAPPEPVKRKGGRPKKL